MAENKKGFKAGLYAVIVGVVLAVVLTAMTIFAFTTRYTGFKPEKVARQYVDTIVQTGDGYNAYKNSLVSENMKYGDFIRKAYINAYKNDGEDVKQAEFVGTGSEEEQKAIDSVYNTMYDYYVELVNTVGWDDYETFFNSYFQKLKLVRHEVYGDDYLDDEYMFGALEANVAAYGESLTGAEETLAADGKTVIKEASEGKYSELFGKDYKLTSEVTECKVLGNDEVKAYAEGYKKRIAPLAECGAAKAETLGLKDEPYVKKILFIRQEKVHTYPQDMIDAYKALDCSDSIESAAEATVEVKDQNGKTVVQQKVSLVKIGNCWYVDNTNLNTSDLYLGK